MGLLPGKSYHPRGTGPASGLLGRCPHHNLSLIGSHLQDVLVQTGRLLRLEILLKKHSHRGEKRALLIPLRD